jgi:Leucine-rich repeat (LRR) protein
MKEKLNYFIIFLLLVNLISATAQKKTPKSAPVVKQTEYKPDVTGDEKKVRDIVAFLEYMLNTLGSSSTPVRDKEVLIKESYAKIFRDAKVQVEDDLDEERRVITNKDVVAYLKDVNFFFSNVRFEFAIESIKGQPLPNGQYFYKVSVRRTLTGTTVEKQAIKNTSPRFLEINYDPKNQDLKIVSIYTNEFNEKEALTAWWSDLSFEWKTVFKEKLSLKDSVQLSDIKRATAIYELDISGNRYVQNLEPLAQLISLRSLNLSNTNTNDLTPIRNLADLVSLNLANTKVTDLSPLKYSAKLAKLDVSNTKVSDIAVLEKLPEVEELNLKGTLVADITALSTLAKLEKLNLKETKVALLNPLQDLTTLTDLNLSSTRIQELTSLRELTNLQYLDIDSTRINDLTPIRELENLNVLYANYTLFSDLSPLKNLKRLTKVYCDNTPIKSEAAETFMQANPNVLIIFDSDDMKGWWSTLSSDWQKVFVKATRISSSPSKEELAKIPLLDSITLGITTINTLEPLRKLLRLKKIKASGTSITDLVPLGAHKEITYLDISETNVQDISIVNHFQQLQILRADKSKIENIERINLPSIKIVYADGTGVNDINASEFLKNNSNSLIVYKTFALERWWQNLPEIWKEIFSNTSTLTREQLHAIVEQQKLQFKDVPVVDLTPLSEFIRLKDLHFSGTSITKIAPTEALKSLKSLHATNSPIQAIESIKQLTDLEELDISNTPIEDIYELWRLSNLKKLTCSGTQIKRLNAVEKLEKLQYLDCSNTNVSKLTALNYLPLKVLKCYNTKISNREIENFKSSHPDCQVMYYR